MNRLAPDLHHADALGPQALRPDVTARAADHHPIEVFDPLLGGEPLADLDEQLGLQLGEPRQPAAHRTRQVVLGEPVRADHVRELRVAHRGELIVRLARRPDLVDRAGLLLVQWVMDWCIVWLLISRVRAVDESPWTALQVLRAAL